MEQETRTMPHRQLNCPSFFTDVIWVKVRACARPPPESEMPSVIQFIGAIITRFLFGIHAVFILWIVLQLYSGVDAYWSLCVGLCLLAVETFYTLIVRKGQEYR
jgi:hypothetical protein